MLKNMSMALPHRLVSAWCRFMVDYLTEPGLSERFHDQNVYNGQTPGPLEDTYQTFNTGSTDPASRAY